MQKEFHDLRTDEALFGGSAGPGKSLALRADPLDVVAMEHLRCQRKEIPWGNSTATILYLRRTMPRQEENIRLSYIFYRQVDPSFRMVDQKSRVIGTFSSGAQVLWSHMKDEDSYLDHRSNAYTRIYFDELIEFEQNQYLEMVTRCRSTDPVLRQMLKVRAATNPAPNWVREYFVDGAPNGRRVRKRVITLTDGSTESRTRIFIPARLSDNPSPEFRRQYETNLRDKPEHIRRALFDGDWYVVAGAFFADVWDPAKVLIEPFPIPRHWKRWRSMDWGLKSPAVVHWWAMDPNGVLICYRERSFNGAKAKKLLSALEVAKAIRDIEQDSREWNDARKQSRIIGPADTQLWEDRGQSGARMVEDMASVGVFWTQAMKRRKTAAEQVFKRLKNGQLKFFNDLHRRNPGYDSAITTISSLRTDESEPEVPQKGGPDHWYDSVSYQCMEFMEKSAEYAANENAKLGELDKDDDEPQPDPRSKWGRYGYGGR